MIRAGADRFPAAVEDFEETVVGGTATGFLPRVDQQIAAIGDDRTGRRSVVVVGPAQKERPVAVLGGHTVVTGFDSGVGTVRVAAGLGRRERIVGERVDAGAVILGIDGIPERAAIALPMVATVSVLTALDAYFNWRSRWILMEEAQYRLQRLRDRMDFYVVTTPEPSIEKTVLIGFFDEQQAIWADVSKRWVDYRKAEKTPETGPESEPT